MKNSKLILCSFAALFVAGQAVAHTGVRDQATEGTSSYNAFTITHGCGGEAGSQTYPVIGQSAVFPDGDTAVWRDQTGAVIEVGGTGGGTLETGKKLSLAVAGIADGSPFANNEEIVDSLGNVHGLLWKDGVMPPNLYALTQFKVTAPTIANNCVKTLKIRIGVINYCDLGKNAQNDRQGPYKAPRDSKGKEVIRTTSAASGFVQVNAPSASKFKDMQNRGNGDNNRADWWFTAPYGGSAYYTDPDLLQPTYWTTLTVNNKAADIALCAGTQVDYSVEPSGFDFDSYLTPTNTQPFTKAAKGGGL